ncbi:MAG: YihY/virulence factor BrkB family protein [Tissierellaceae bacterium]|nr:YihY/virulence factor BrkB family protein [Tissierellaceae bacterium]
MIFIKSFLERLTKSKPIIFLDQLIYRIQEDAVIASGTQLAYFLVLSIFPFIIVFLNILSYTPLVREDVLNGMIIYLPLETQKLIQAFVSEITASSSQGLLSVAAILGLLTASSGLKAIIKAINRAYDYKETRSYIKLRLMSFIFTLALLILLTLVLLSLVLGEVVGNKLFSTFGRGDIFIYLWSYLRLIIPLVYMVLIFGLLYKFSPCTSKINDIPFSTTLPGAIFASLGWMLISVFFSYYVNNFGRYAVTYGSLVGIILLLIWLYISSVIIVIGGEINATIEHFKLYGYRIHKDKSIISKRL